MIAPAYLTNVTFVVNIVTNVLGVVALVLYVVNVGRANVRFVGSVLIPLVGIVIAFALIVGFWLNIANVAKSVVR